MAYEEKEEEGSKSPDKKLLDQALKHLKECIDDESDERAKMMDDLLFCTLDQWPSEIRKEREDVNQEGGPRPCLTIDKINQYIVQVVNDMRQGKPGINVRPQDDSADIETAKILKGLVRNIEDQSNADIAYATAGESAAKIGLGFFRITTEYVEDSFDEQEIVIKSLPNTFSVYLGPHVMPDGSDSKHGFIIETMPLDKFKSEYPGKKWKQGDFEDLGNLQSYWHTGETVTVAEYYCLERINQTLYLLADGTSISQKDYDAWPLEAGVKPSIQKERPSFREQLKWAKMTGVEILDKRDLPGKYIPIVEVIGRESYVKGKRCLWGLVRPAKDSLRMYNYFASTITEKMGLSPKAPFVGAVGQFEGVEQQWREANRKNKAYLEYKPIDVNGNAIPAPERQGSTPMEAALLNQMQVIEHDVQTSLGMFKAATGESESQQSGRAILALQRESDTGTYHFGANQGVSIRHAGRIVVDMIPHYYDTKRIVRILGEDGEIKTVRLDPDQETSRRDIQGPQGIESIYNPGVGKYDVSITVGPSYNTKRMEEAATYVEMSKGAADPASAAVLRYLVMRSSDSAGSEEAARLLKTLLPPQTLQAMESKGPVPPQVQAMVQEMQMKMQQMMEEGQKLQEENMKLKSGEQSKMAGVQVDAQAQSEKATLARQEAEAEFTLKKERQDAEFALQKDKQDKEIQLAREKAEAEVLIKDATAAADHKREQDRLAFDIQCHSDELKAKAEKENEVGAEKIAPQIVKALETIVSSLADQSKFNTQLVEQLSKPKKVILGGIQRGSEGITGASATVQ